MVYCFITCFVLQKPYSYRSSCLLFIGFALLLSCSQRLVLRLLTLFVFRKWSLQKFGVNIHDVSIRAIIEELSTHFAAEKLIIYLVHRLPILRVMQESSTRNHIPFGLASEPIKCLHRHPLGFVIDRRNTSASVL